MDKPLFMFDTHSEGDIQFSTEKYNDILVLKENGDIYVKGNKITNDMEVVLAMKEFLERSNLL